MTNPFDDPRIQHLVLVNERREYSLWPSFADVPAGWSTVHGPDSREECVGFVEANWADPTGLRTRRVTR